MKFVRNDEYQQKLFLEALNEKHVVQDAKIVIIRDKGKNRAYCPQVSAFLQFPNNLRFWNTEYVADVIEVHPEGRAVFYRVVRGSIRKPGSDALVG